MKKLLVKMQSLTTIENIIESFLFCTDNTDNISRYIKDGNITSKGSSLLLNNLINTNKPHLQIMNQIQFRIIIYNTTRSVLQEFARHRMGNEFLVKSTRYSLHKISKDQRINENKYNENELLNIVSDYYYIPIDDFIDVDEKNKWINDRYNELYYISFYKKKYKMKNDKLKKYINEYMFTNIVSVMSGTALKNFFDKRLSNQSFYQIRNLANELYNNIPKNFKFLF